MDDDQCDPATMTCLDCGEDFCDICGKVHRRQKATKSHTLVKHEDLTREHLQMMAKNQETYCNLHPHETIKLFCHTCKKCICIVQNAP